MTRNTKISIGVAAVLAVAGGVLLVRQPTTQTVTLTPPPMPPGMTNAMPAVKRVVRLAAAPAPTPKTNEVSVSIVGESFNTRRLIQSKPMSGGSWQTIANRGTNFSMPLQNLPNTMFRAVSVRTNTVRFAWDASEIPEPGMFFRIHSGRSSGNYTNHVNLSGTVLSGALTNLPAGNNYVAVTKVWPGIMGVWGESESPYSNEVVVNVSPLTSNPPRPILSIR